MDLAKYYILVQWIEHDKVYSVVENNDIIDINQRNLGNDLINNTYDFAWKDESSPATVLAVDGKKKVLEKECLRLADEAADESFEAAALGKGKRQRKKVQLSSDESSSEELETVVQKKKFKRTASPLKTKVLEELQARWIETPNFNIVCEKCSNLEQKLAISEAKSKETIEKYKGQIRKLKKELEDFHEKSLPLSEADEIDIGNGVKVPRIELEHQKSFNSSPAIFSRHLLKMVFSIEELRKSSLYGIKCNANKFQKNILPALGSKRVNAVIDYCVATCQKELQPNAKIKIRASLGALLRELRFEKPKATP